MNTPNVPAGQQTVSLIGAGVMGQAIGARLLESGVDLTVFDLDEHRVATLTERGACAAESAKIAGESGEVVILSLNSAEIVRRAVFGREGVAEGCAPGTLIIDMSSIDPVATRTLAKDAETRQLRWLDCPLSGGAPKAARGELTVMAGGREEAFDAAQPVMALLCANFNHMGPSGAGQTTKLINQVLAGLNFVAVAEATQLALDAGVDATRIPHALAGGRADSAILQEYMPRMAFHDYTPMGRLDNMVKDLIGVQDLARTTGTSMPMTALCAEIHRLVCAAGFGPADNAALMQYYNGFANID